MLMVVVGQVTSASASSCKMGPKIQPSMMDHSSHMMDHSSHGIAEPMDQDSTSMGDCCDKDGSCSMSGCLSLSILAITVETSAHMMNFSSGLTVSPVQLSLSNISFSLYRPPISS